MAKTWQCTRCGQLVETTIRDSLNRTEPEECGNCGNGDYQALRTTGTLHKSVEGNVGGATTRRRVLQGLGGGAAVAAGSWWFFGRPTVATDPEVEMLQNQFRPRNVEVDLGTTVTWSNEEDSGQGEPITYLLRSTSEWDFQADVPEGEETTYTFEESGVYGLYAEGIGSPDLTGMSMKIGVGESIDEPLGGWF
jgi:plastocyanin